MTPAFSSQALPHNPQSFLSCLSVIDPMWWPWPSRRVANGVGLPVVSLRGGPATSVCPISHCRQRQGPVWKRSKQPRMLSSIPLLVSSSPKTKLAHLLWGKLCGECVANNLQIQDSLQNLGCGDAQPREVRAWPGQVQGPVGGAGRPKLPNPLFAIFWT